VSTYRACAAIALLCGAIVAGGVIAGCEPFTAVPPVFDDAGAGSDVAPGVVTGHTDDATVADAGGAADVALGVDATATDGAGRMDAPMGLDATQTDSPAADAPFSDAAAADAPANVDAAPDGPANLIANGDFANGLANWHITVLGLPDAAVPYLVDGGSLCIPIAGLTTATDLGWPADPSMGVRIVPNDGYIFSYQTWTTVSATEGIQAIEGEVSGQAHDVTLQDNATTTAQTFVHPFSNDAGRDAAGVAFIIGYTIDAGLNEKVCFSNVSLVDTSASP
jgi:hypothetical protein